MKLIQFQYQDFLACIHIENGRSGVKYFSDGHLSIFKDLKSVKEYLKNQINYAFSNLDKEYQIYGLENEKQFVPIEISIKNYVTNKLIETDYKVEDKLELIFLEFVDSLEVQNIKSVYKDLLTKVFIKHSKEFTKFYDQYVPDLFYEKELILVEMFDHYKNDTLNHFINDEIFTLDMLSNKEKAVCLNAFMEMYASEKKDYIQYKKERFFSISSLMNEFIGREQSEKLENTIQNKNQEEEKILHSWAD